NQLRCATRIVRRGADDDTEVYWYDGAGQRATKLGTAQTSGTTRIERVRYLPGLELRQIEQTPTGATMPTPVERLQVLTLGAAGRCSVRMLHWELGQPPTIGNDQLRVSLDDQIGSSMLELDAQADILTWEEYYPYGGTAVWSARSDTEAKYKYVRYSGQERDATGLYYYGFRYYAPWLARWPNPDPAGPVDGLNLFCMVGNNPVNRWDLAGLIFEKIFSEVKSRIPLNSATVQNDVAPPRQATRASLKADLISMLEAITESDVKALEMSRGAAENQLSARPVANRTEAAGETFVKPQKSSFDIKHNKGEGDCLLHALYNRDLEESEVIQRREELASAPQEILPSIISGTEVAFPLQQSGLFGQSENEWSLSGELQNLVGGKHLLPRSIYSAMIRVPGIYLGEYEVQSYTAISEKIVFIVTEEGELREISSHGRRDVLRLSKENWNTFYGAIGDILKSPEKNIVLFKSSDHWERINGVTTP
ncbi:RHS repeat-associated core domain-containing protein, partial [Burkholderia ubonensis]|uniref:RHS repeat-associated core domain-containing protein n=1 Tax=Burkholderia ubonensis TaxID=101571 RepID=UPI000B18ED92